MDKAHKRDFWTFSYLMNTIKIIRYQAKVQNELTFNNAPIHVLKPPSNYYLPLYTYIDLEQVFQGPYYAQHFPL